LHLDSVVAGLLLEFAAMSKSGEKGRLVASLASLGQQGLIHICMQGIPAFQVHGKDAHSWLLTSAPFMSKADSGASTQSNGHLHMSTCSALRIDLIQEEYPWMTTALPSQRALCTY